MNNKLEVARKERRKKKEIKKRQKVEVIATKQCRTRGGKSLFSKKKDKSDIKNDINLD